MDRAGRRERWQASFSPGSLAAAGAAISCAYLFQRSLEVRVVMFLLSLLAAFLAGKRVSVVSLLLVSASIVAANLLVPVGKVLAVIGPLKITQAALTDGIMKALVLEGLIFISKSTIIPGLRLPGRFGAIVASSFVYYDRIVEYKGIIKPATLIADADRLMLMVWNAPIAVPSPTARRRQGLAPSLALAAAVLAAYASLLISRGA